jgi:hypothetical protein
MNHRVAPGVSRALTRAAPVRGASRGARLVVSASSKGSKERCVLTQEIFREHAGNIQGIFSEHHDSKTDVWLVFTTFQGFRVFNVLPIS